MNRKILVGVGVLAAIGVIAFLLFGRTKAKAKPKPTAEADAGAGPKLAAPTPARLAAGDAIVWRDDDPIGPLRLEGQVIDAQDHGVKGAVVSIDTSPPRELTVQDDGSFEITGLIARDYRLEAHAADGHAGPVQLRLAPDSQPVTLRLAPAGVVQVVVKDATLGMPIAGAKVELRGAIVLAATTGGDGVAELRGVGAGWNPLHVEAQGYAPSAMMLSVTGDPAVPQRQVVTLSLGVAVRGHVLDDQGKPIAGARVLASPASQPFPVVDPRRDAVLTDAQGGFELSALAAGTYRFSASAPTYAPASTPPTVIDGRHVRDDLELRLDRGATVSGFVRSPDGTGVGAASVRVVGRGSVDWRLTRQAYTDAKGAFRIDGLPRRMVDVVAWHPRGASALEPADLAATPAAEVTLTLDLTGSVAGTVVDGAGEPVGDAQLVAEPVWTGALGESNAWVVRGVQAAVADSGGAFRFDGLPEGAYALRAARPGASEAALWLSAPTATRTGDTALRIVLAADGTVTGKVALPDGKAPAMFTIAIGAARPVPFATTDGTFSVTAPGGKHALEIAGATFVRKTVSVDVVPDDTVDLGTLTVAAGRSISGRVLDPNGAPVAGAKVAAGTLIAGGGTETELNIPEEGFNVQETTTDDDGRFGMEGFSPAPVALVAGKDGVGRSASVSVPRGPDSVTLELVLAATGALDGVVTAAGTPVSDTAVIASPLGAARSNFFVVTGADGSFAYDALTAGRYLLFPMIGGGGSRPKDMYIRVIDVAAGARARADIDATPGPHTLDVSAKDDTGQPVALAMVALLQADVDAPTMEALRDATWLLDTSTTTALYIRQIRDGAASHFEGVVAGRYSACVTPYPASGVDPDSAEQAPMKCVPVTLPGPATLEVVVPAAWVAPP